MTTPPQPPNQPPSGGGFGPPPPGGQPPGGGGPPGGQPAGPPMGPPGGQPQQPGPYGGGPYGAPPPGGGYGQPPGGPGQPQPGFPGPYGQPTPPPPNNKNKIILIVVAAVVAVAVLVGVGVAALSGGDDKDHKAKPGKSSSESAEPSEEESEEPEPTPTETDTEYDLAFPKTLENNTFKRTKDLSDTVKSGSPDEEANLGSYTKKTDNTERLLYAAAKGNDFGNPDLSKDQMMKGMETSPSMTVAVKRRDITPSGADDPLTCEVLVKSQSGRKLTIPVCAWSDPGTAAYVANDSNKTYFVKPADFDLDAFADRVNTIRDEVRTPAQ